MWSLTTPDLHNGDAEKGQLREGRTSKISGIQLFVNCAVNNLMVRS
jgi:hypothetical protein